MDWTTILVAGIAFAGTAVGSIAGVRASNKLVEFRLNELTKKVEVHNGAMDRIIKLEECQKSVKHRLDNLEKVI